MEQKIKKVTQKIEYLPTCRSFTVIGDPGYDGVGISMMEVYANALEEASADDFVLVTGDLVSTGDARHSETITEITNSLASNPVYVLRGNHHDTETYSDYFGLRNYGLVTPDFAIVVLDNAGHTFDEEGLSLLGEILARKDCRNVIISCYLPVPNCFFANGVSCEEFFRLRKVYLPYKEKIKYFVCGLPNKEELKYFVPGHVHSCSKDPIDGIPFIYTAGVGTMIQDISGNIAVSDADHHIVRFHCEDGVLRHEIVDLTDRPYAREVEDSTNRGNLSTAVKGELYTHLRYLTFAERAQKRGSERLAHLFFALAESKYCLARSFFAILDRKPRRSNDDALIVDEIFKHESYVFQVYNRPNREFPLSRQAYQAGADVAKIHSDLLTEATSMDSFDPDTIYVCPMCGFVMTVPTDRCPVCGASARQFKEYKV